MGNRRVQLRLMTCVLACAVALGLAGCGVSVSNPDEGSSGGTAGSDGGTGAAGPVVSRGKIVSDFPLSGGSRAQTESMVKAIEMALEEAGFEAGGIPIEYVSKNDSSAQSGEWDEAKCAQNITEAAGDQEVIAFIGPFNSGCAQAQIKIANQAGLAMVSPATTAVGLTKPGGDPGEPDKYYPSGTRNFLRLALADDMQARGAVVWATTHLGKKKAYVLHDKETYGKGIADQFRGAASSAGLEIVGFEGIDKMAPNYRGVTSKIEDSGADIVYFGGIFNNNGGQLAKDVRAALGDIAFMGPDGIFDAAFIEAAGSAAEGSYATFGGLPPEKLTGKGSKFIKAYQDKHGEPAAYTAYAYDTAGTIIGAINRCGEGDGVSRGCVLEQLFATSNYDGALGNFSFTETGDTDFTKLSGFQVKGDEWVFAQELDVAEVAQ